MGDTSDKQEENQDSIPDGGGHCEECNTGCGLSWDLKVGGEGGAAEGRWEGRACQIKRTAQESKVCSRNKEVPAGRGGSLRGRQGPDPRRAPRRPMEAKAWPISLMKETHSAHSERLDCATAALREGLHGCLWLPASMAMGSGQSAWPRGSQNAWGILSLLTYTDSASSSSRHQETPPMAIKKQTCPLSTHPRVPPSPC